MRNTNKIAFRPPSRIGSEGGNRDFLFLKRAVNGKTAAFFGETLRRGHICPRRGIFIIIIR